MLVATELYNTAVSYYDAMKYVRYNWVLVVTELFVSETQCTSVRDKANAFARPIHVRLTVTALFEGVQKMFLLWIRLGFQRVCIMYVLFVPLCLIFLRCLIEHSV